MSQRSCGCLVNATTRNASDGSDGDPVSRLLGSRFPRQGRTGSDVQEGLPVHVCIECGCAHPLAHWQNTISQHYARPKGRFSVSLDPGVHMQDACAPRGTMRPSSRRIGYLREARGHSCEPGSRQIEIPMTARVSSRLASPSRPRNFAITVATIDVIAAGVRLAAASGTIPADWWIANCCVRSSSAESVAALASGHGSRTLLSDLVSSHTWPRRGVARVAQRSGWSLCPMRFVRTFVSTSPRAFTERGALPGPAPV